MAAALVFAAASLCVSGCSIQNLGYVGMGVGDFTTTWTVGSCHRLDQPEEVDPVFPSDTSPAVPCYTPHESETYAVVPLTGPIAAYATRPSPLVLEHALSGACSWNAMSSFLGAQPIDALLNVGVLQILPSQPEWKRGVRQIRCDALIGPRSSESVASIDRSLHSILSEPAGDRFRVCRSDGQEVGCDQPHDAELMNVWTQFAPPRTAAALKVQKQKVLAFCRQNEARYLGAQPAAGANIAVQAGLPTYPPTTGEETGQCWLADGKERPWTGSLRSGVKALP
ncbi:MAG TPA: septum formation family protein [Actinospica sp.]|nr:septum formation family protein [Actinospica sp.]